MFSKIIAQGLALSALISIAAADCNQGNGKAAALFESCGQVQGSMNVCTTGAVTSCSCSVLSHQSACYSSYKANYCPSWNYQNDYFSANCGDNMPDETTSTSKADSPASTSAEATTTAESSAEASSSSSASSRSSAASASASATSSAASKSSSKSSSSASKSSASASKSDASAAASASASASATPAPSNAAGVMGLDSLLMGAGLVAALI